MYIITHHLRLKRDTDSSTSITFLLANALLLLSSQLRTESPLQFRDYLLIWNGFSTFILLYHLRFLINYLQKTKSPFRIGGRYSHETVFMHE